MSVSHSWCSFHKLVKTWDSTTWFIIWHFQTPAQKLYNQMRFLAERFHILAWWSAFSKRGSQDLSNGTNVNVWLANFFLSVHVLYWTWRSFIVRFFPHFCLLVDYSKYFFSCSVAEGMEFVDLLSSCNLLNHNFLYFPWLPVETGTSFIRKQTFFGSSTWRTSCCTSVQKSDSAADFVRDHLVRRWNRAMSPDNSGVFKFVRSFFCSRAPLAPFLLWSIELMLVVGFGILTFDI